MIYVKFSPPKTIKEFLEEFYDAINSWNLISVATYKDKECTELQCAAGRSRSFDDMYELITTYYPETTRKDLVHELLTFRITRPNGYFYFANSYCYEIKRPVIGYYFQFIKFGPLSIEGYGGYLSTGKQKAEHSWKELFAMVDIKTKKQLFEYIFTK